VVVAICERIDAVSYISVNAVRRGWPNGYSHVLSELVGSGTVLPDEYQITTGEAVEGMELRESQPPEFSTLEVVDVLVESDTDPSDRVAVRREIEVPSEGLPADAWVRYDGTIQSSPCS